jgi:beta-xylosidase
MKILPFRSLLAFVLLQAFAILLPLKAQNIRPVIPGDFADPSVIRKGKEYFAIGTSSEWAPHFPIFKSTNLQDWQQTGYVFDKAPDWTSGSFWAPEYYFHNNTYFIYYTARRKSDNVSYIGVATSRFPDRGFKDHGIIIEHGKEAIDAFVYNDNGTLYITWKAYGLDTRPIEILGSRLSENGLSLQGETFSMLKDEPRIGLEGQSILKKDGYYYLFYSAGNCCGVKCDYNVRIARAKNFKGPYELYENNPVLQENAEWKCSGHGTFVNSPEGKTYYLYHAYNKASTVFTGRQGMLAELSWPETNGWPVFKELSPLSNSNNFTDSFNGKTPSISWQWDFRNSSPTVTQKGGDLHLSGSINKNNNAGLVYTLRPAAAVYDMSATVENHNSSLKGLAIYGDANAAIGVGVAGENVEYWVVKDNTRRVVASQELKSSTGPVTLKISTGADMTYKVYWAQAEGQWNELKAEGNTTLEFLPPWDRSPRVGLHFKGSEDQEAIFSTFELIYK